MVIKFVPFDRAQRTTANIPSNVPILTSFLHGSTYTSYILYLRTHLVKRSQIHFFKFDY